MKRTGHRHPFARRTWRGDVDALEREIYARQPMTREELDDFLRRKLAQARRNEPDTTGPDWPDSEAT